jgi:hypothetical protein
VFLQGVRDGSERPSALLLVSSDWGWQPASGRQSCRGTVTPPGPIEIHLANQKRRLETRRSFSQSHGSGQNIAPGPVVQLSIITLRTLQTLVGRLRGRGHARRRDLKGKGLLNLPRKVRHKREEVLKVWAPVGSYPSGYPAFKASVVSNRLLLWSTGSASPPA